MTDDRFCATYQGILLYFKISQNSIPCDDRITDCYYVLYDKTNRLVETQSNLNRRCSGLCLLT